MKITWKAITAVFASLAITMISLGSSADGASTSVASQISTLQKKVAQMQQQINALSTAPQTSTADIMYSTLSAGCMYPADVVTILPDGYSVICHIAVAVPLNSMRGF